MRIGIPREIKNFEDRVGVIPAGVQEFVAAGHEVFVESGAGLGAGLSDEAYVAAGATILPDAETVFDKAHMVCKVKELQEIERKRLRDDHIVFTYLHLAPDPDQTNDLIASGATCIAYETVTSPTGGLPLLTPMSEVAGRMAVQAGARCLENAANGCGMLLGGVPGVPPANVLILGGGVAGSHAAQIALGLGARVTVVDRSLEALRRLNVQFGTSLRTVYSSKQTIAELVAESQLVIGTVLIPGASAPKLITRAMLGTMEKGSAIVDVAIDQGGCTETSKATTHSDPTYVVDGVVHYCVANMPGGVARTSTFALANATLPFALAIANKGWKKALAEDPHLKAGLNVHAGKVNYKAVSDALGLSYVDADMALAS